MVFTSVKHKKSKIKNGASVIIALKKDILELLFVM